MAGNSTMVNLDSTFPIVVMTRNEGKDLINCINSIFETTKIDIKIYLVDNNSDDQEHLAILTSLNLRFSDKLEIIKNKKNRWILGLNDTLKKVRNLHSSPYFFITDGDIDFSNCKAKPCWLSYLISQMDSNIVVGKLGLSLDWNYISTQDDFLEILDQERSLYNENKKINQLYIAQVDTTATIFRWDWSMESSGCLYPDHMRYLRPELYSCRTDKELVVEHLGWYKYKINTLPLKTINSKVICFTIVGAALKKEIVSQASIITKVFNCLFSRPCQIYWILRRYYFLCFYIIKKGRRLFDGQK